MSDNPQTLLDNAFEPILIFCEKDGLKYFNHFCSSFFKQPPRVLRGIKKIEELIKCEQANISKQIKETLKKQDILISKEIQINLAKQSNFSYVVVCKTIPIVWDGKKAAMLCLNDLSVERSLHDKYREQVNQLKETYEQIVHSDKLATLGELTASVSHEINNPLTIASGSAEVVEILLENEDLNTQRDNIKNSTLDILNSLRRINEIVMNMKSFLHKSEDKKEYCDLAEIIAKSCELIHPMYSDGNVELTQNVERENVVGLVNRIKIEQVLVNLLKNAFQAIEEGLVEKGRVTISLSKDDVAGAVIIRVEDNGPGIPEEIQKEIFNPFFTTKDIGEGTGLGLALSSKMIEGHGGKLVIEKTSSKGTLFKIELPALEVSSFMENEKILTGLASKEGKKILVVDNEVQVLNVLNKFFEEEDYIFIGSTNGEDALKITEMLTVDMIISDIKMPGMSGSEFAEEVRKNKITCPILYLTSNKYMHHYDEDKKRLGINGLILKPFSREEVFKTIKLAFKEK